MNSLRKLKLRVEAGSSVSAANCGPIEEMEAP